MKKNIVDNITTSIKLLVCLCIIYIVYKIIPFLISSILFSFDYFQINGNYYSEFKHSKIEEIILLPDFISVNGRLSVGKKYPKLNILDSLKVITDIEKSNSIFLLSSIEKDTNNENSLYYQFDDKNYLIYLNLYLYYNDINLYVKDYKYIIEKYNDLYGKNYKVYFLEDSDQTGLTKYFNYYLVWKSEPSTITMKLSVTDNGFVYLKSYKNEDFFAKMNLDFEINTKYSTFGKRLYKDDLNKFRKQFGL